MLRVLFNYYTAMEVLHYFILRLYKCLDFVGLTVLIIVFI